MFIIPNIVLTFTMDVKYRGSGCLVKTVHNTCILSVYKLSYIRFTLSINFKKAKVLTQDKHCRPGNWLSWLYPVENGIIKPFHLYKLAHLSLDHEQHYFNSMATGITSIMTTINNYPCIHYLIGGQNIVNTRIV